ncbi:MAG: metallophosphoesterase family protein [Lachnospiraceae bacterium]
MKILIVSDTHKKHKNLEIVLERMRPIDMLIHLGDAEGYDDYIADIAGCRMEIVAGNNDFFTKLPLEKDVQIGNYKALITHGHYYYVNSGYEDLKRDAEARRYDIVMFGHTHRPVIDYDDNIVTLNPGSLSYPRQDGKAPSYIVMEIDKKGRAHFELEYLQF